MEVFDIIILGGGLAGTSAALTARNRGKNVAVVTNNVETSSLYKAEMISNYPGIIKMKGSDMANLLRRQLEDCGAEVISGRALNAVPFGDSFGVAVGNDFYQGKTLILATGITREKLYPGEAEFLGRGVSYCATCDGMLYRGKTVAVVGNNNEAKDDAEFLRGIGCDVLPFEKQAKYEIIGSEKAEALVCNGESFPVDCVFIIKDTISVTKLVSGLECSAGGIVVNKSMETSVSGVFAAGDCVGKPYQLAKAAGDGNVAALSACEYIDRMKSV